MEEEIKKVITVLKKGGTILYPTDTVWGIGCDATNSKAVKKVYTIKRREEDKSFIILLDDIKKLTAYIKDINLFASDLINSYDKPLTIIYPEAKKLATNLIAKDGSIGIRITKDEFCVKLISTFGKPIVSTSANISGEPVPLSYSKISQEIINGVDYVVSPTFEKIIQFKPSTIIKLSSKEEFHVIRD